MAETIAISDEDFMDAWEVLHHLYRFFPAALEGVLTSIDMSDERFGELLAVRPADWVDGWGGPGDEIAAHAGF